MKLTQKLQDFDDSPQGIQTLSGWILFHISQSRASVRVWNNELKKVGAAHMLKYLYLCNDVLQKSRRKGNQFREAFASVLPEAMQYIYTHSSKDIPKIERVLSIWKDREVYPAEFIDSIRVGLQSQIPALEIPALEPVSTVSLDLGTLAELTSALSSAGSAVPTATAAAVAPSPPEHPLVAAIKDLEAASMQDQLVAMKFDIQTKKCLQKLKAEENPPPSAKAIQEAQKNVMEHSRRLTEQIKKRKALLELMEETLLMQKNKLVAAEDGFQDVLAAAATLKDYLLSQQADPTSLPQPSQPLATQVQAPATQPLKTEPLEPAAVLNGPDEGSSSESNPPPKRQKVENAEVEQQAAQPPTETESEHEIVETEGARNSDSWNPLPTYGGSVMLDDL
eukprot:CAMPEP_0175123994 /NCGR_PEP_ID=MMETSP0087-20121206/2540_1 /TAXON_ID=136419 /ORGANISM="Unknown Unknown, Strain D1" /LENGTH=392 /DNA_ID=CAMNT_0016405723 /DNA_START=133 /DNA_END=1311 /DNA_ORIENTATION=-